MRLKTYETSALRLQLLFVLLTVALFLATLAVNEWFFHRLEFTRGINWVYLPAGVRLLCMLLFGGAGAIGLLIGCWLASFLYFFPDDLQRAFMGGVLAVLGPWLVYLGAQRAWGLQVSLAKLSPARLLWLGAGCAVISPLMHHLYFAWRGQSELVSGFIAMSIGDFVGILIVLYAIKGLLALIPQPA